MHHIKIRGREKDDKSLLIYEQGKPADYFVLILEGRVEVTVGFEHLLFECGPFTYFGTQALVQNVGVGEKMTEMHLLFPPIIIKLSSPFSFIVESPKKANGSLQSLNLDAVMNQTFIPDYSVRAVSDVFYVAVKRTLYLAAKRATLMQKSKRFGSETGSNEPLDYEVEKVNIFLPIRCTV